MANKKIKETIRDFVKFNVEEDFYDEPLKAELVKQFKEILFDEDPVVRNFLDTLFTNIKKIADHYELIAQDSEVKEEPKKKKHKKEEKEEPKKKEPKEEEKIKQESYSGMYRKIAAEMLYE